MLRTRATCTEPSANFIDLSTDDLRTLADGSRPLPHADIRRISDTAYLQRCSPAVNLIEYLLDADPACRPVLPGERQPLPLDFLQSGAQPTKAITQPIVIRPDQLPVIVIDAQDSQQRLDPLHTLRRQRHSIKDRRPRFTDHHRRSCFQPTGPRLLTPQGPSVQNRTGPRVEKTESLRQRGCRQHRKCERVTQIKPLPWSTPKYPLMLTPRRVWPPWSRTAQESEGMTETPPSRKNRTRYEHSQDRFSRKGDVPQRTRPAGLHSSGFTQDTRRGAVAGGEAEKFPRHRHEPSPLSQPTESEAPTTVRVSPTRR
ncbi:hypothetical protein SGR_7030t [Streptomyces griseus subsp. griseus NBRC 13350]|uniref:Uncharacterized protein n=1 Tax=Streptomyces griseus subsp. griseus (strain JCM 4626 / CBS 651.72 / NBRC 13350 / KCC S-0626 / ISP 5235) TaxID=455632 RepID=B1VNB5_STRGG|nr:hypothetical protein SGR_109t [Streptomyces griseus subsp. griseus NBRC 13350]BAG23857.1 hypothetical protein SGR_7030t [Streptomyces griseus subsp. griseus NBRC 13350]